MASRRSRSVRSRSSRSSMDLAVYHRGMDPGEDQLPGDHFIPRLRKTLFHPRLAVAYLPGEGAGSERFGDWVDLAGLQAKFLVSFDPASDLKDAPHERDPSLFPYRGPSTKQRQPRWAAALSHPRGAKGFAMQSLLYVKRRMPRRSPLRWDPSATTIATGSRCVPAPARNSSRQLPAPLQPFRRDRRPRTGSRSQVRHPPPSSRG